MNESNKMCFDGKVNEYTVNISKIIPGYDSIHKMAFSYLSCNASSSSKCDRNI